MLLDPKRLKKRGLFSYDIWGNQEFETDWLVISEIKFGYFEGNLGVPQAPR